MMLVNLQIAENAAKNSIVRISAQFSRNRRYV